MIPRTVSPSPRRSFSRLARRAATAVALVSLTMCNLDHIDVSVGGKATIPKASLLNTLLGNLAVTGFGSIDFSEQFQNQGVGKGDVDAVNMKTFTLTIDAPAAGNFDFIDAISFFAEASGVPKVQIATLSPVPKGKTKLDLVVDATVDLAPFVVAPSMSISSQVKGSAPAEDTTVDAEVVLDVNVHIPGCG
jgi:hypothetical protein